MQEPNLHIQQEHKNQTEEEQKNQTYIMYDMSTQKHKNQTHVHLRRVILDKALFNNK